MDAFDLIAINNSEIEPFIIPEPQENEDRNNTQRNIQDESQELDGFDDCQDEDNYEDALDNSALLEDEDTPVTTGFRHSARSTAGVPPIRYGWNQEF